MILKEQTRVVVPRNNAPCLQCQDRHFDADGRMCHATCEQYRAFKDGRTEIWKKQAEVARSERAANGVIFKGISRSKRTKPRER